MSQIQLQCRRGMLELDFIFKRFLDKHYSQLSDHDQQLFSLLLNEEDPTLYDWLIADVPCTNVNLQKIVSLINEQCLNDIQSKILTDTNAEISRRTKT